jgi:peptidoglycan/xylan/chitin deacetylase (PgdA/CDA1 family)
VSFYRNHHPPFFDFMQGPRPYSPPLLIRASILLHGMGAVLCIGFPTAWPWVLMAVVLDHLLLTLLGLYPQSQGLGANCTRIDERDPAHIYLTFDDGPDPEITPKVLDLLDQWECKATFFLIGERVRTSPDLARQIRLRGHGIGNHSDRHPIGFALKGIRGFEQDLRAAQDAIRSATGVQPLWFRAPFGFRSPLLEPALCRLGLTLVSWTHRGYDTRERSPQRVERRLLTDLAAGDILLLHDTRDGRTLEGTSMTLEVLPRVLETLQQQGFRSAVLPDPA